MATLALVSVTYRAVNQPQASEQAKEAAAPTFMRRSLFAIIAKKERSNEVEVNLGTRSVLSKVAFKR
jgi:hypothetical protein